jgi:hypothetical protein
VHRFPLAATRERRRRRSRNGIEHSVELRGDLRGYRVEELDGGHATPRIIL